MAARAPLFVGFLCILAGCADDGVSERRFVDPAREGGPREVHDAADASRVLSDGASPARAAHDAATVHDAATHDAGSSRETGAPDADTDAVASRDGARDAALREVGTGADPDARSTDAGAVES